MDLNIYTDGSSTKYFNRNIGGAAWIEVLNGVKIIHGSKAYMDATNNIAELRAIDLGLYFLIKEINMKRVDPSQFTNINIITDSEYAIGVITGEKTARANLDIINEIRTKYHTLLSKLPNLNIEFKHVRGHSGDQYNEECDKMAKNKIKEIKSTLKAKQNGERS